MNKRLLGLLALSFVFVGCNEKKEESKAINFDLMTQASGKYFYESSSLLTKEAYVPFINDRLGAVVVTTINEDQSPNMMVARPGVTEDGDYLMFGLAENRTKENIIARQHVAFLSYEYDKTGGENGKSKNIGFRMIAEYVGDEENKRLNEAAGFTELAQMKLFCKIVEVLPLG